jgi:hypothetical protein
VLADVRRRLKLIQVAYEQIVAAVEASSPGSFQYLKI